MTSIAAVFAAAVVMAWTIAGVALAQAVQPAAGNRFFKPSDVVALVGGEDMVVRRDDPDLELLVLQQPGFSSVKFRNLAFEGDTVFEQVRDLNFPSWEDQIKSVSATVVVAQFGKMESLAGPDGVPAFAAAYEQFLNRLAGDKRRILLLGANAPKGAPPDQVVPYNAAARALAGRRGWVYVDVSRGPLAADALSNLGIVPHHPADPDLAVLVRRKNMLWFHYWRPQNWAFLHGDRTEQQSSRDHRDPSKRWFPDEMKQWLPLVAAKEAQIKETLDTDRQP